jgi:hypothetical protein
MFGAKVDRTMMPLLSYVQPATGTGIGVSCLVMIYQNWQSVDFTRQTSVQGRLTSYITATTAKRSAANFAIDTTTWRRSLHTELFNLSQSSSLVVSRLPLLMGSE